MGQIAPQPAPDPAKLLSSADPHAAANKKLVYDFYREVLEAGHLDLAEHYLTPSYIQHNPMVPTGRDGFVAFFGKFTKPSPIADKLQTPLISLVAEGDKVVVSYVAELPDPKEAGKSYRTTFFDMFRIENGKIAEHWDNMQRQ
jgi:predicted SnoaL-like aldol condensation-catalyzing enzyme